MSVPVFFISGFHGYLSKFALPLFFISKKTPAYFFSYALIFKHPFQKERNTYLYDRFTDYFESKPEYPDVVCLWVTWRSCVSTITLPV